MASNTNDSIKLQIDDVSNIMDDDETNEQIEESVEDDAQDEEEEEEEDDDARDGEEDEDDEDEDEDDEDDDANEDVVDVDDVELSGDDEDDDIEEPVIESSVPKKSSKKKTIQASSLSEMLQSVSQDNQLVGSEGTVETEEELSSDEDEDDEDDVSEDYLQKFKTTSREDYILNFHPEEKIHNYNEVEKFSKVVRDKNGIIKDPFHKTTPIMTRYEKTKVLGQRAKQIDSGCKIFVKAPANTIDGYLIAQEELKQKKLPFIIRRPIPNGGIEYWPVRELDVIN